LVPPGFWRFFQDDKEGSSRQSYMLIELWLRIRKRDAENGTELVTTLETEGDRL